MYGGGGGNGPILPKTFVQMAMEMRDAEKG